MDGLVKCGARHFRVARLFRTLGQLVGDRGQGANWQVIGHVGDTYDDAAVQPWRVIFATTAEHTTGPGGATASDIVALSPGLPSPGSSVPVTSGRYPVRCLAMQLLMGPEARRAASHKYTLTEVIGEGSFGVVWAATSAEAPDVRLVVKVHKEKEVDRRDLMLEAIVLDRCRSHPNCVQFVDLFERDSKPHFVFLDAGRELNHMLVGTVSGVVHVRTLVRHMNHALGHLHGMSLVHGDLKPPNILVTVSAGAWHCTLVDVGNACEARTVAHLRNTTWNRGNIL
jgi:hypothetical protein